MTEFKQFNTEIFVMEKVSENNNSVNCDFDKLTLEKCTYMVPPVERPDICLKQGVKGVNIVKLQGCR